MTEKPTTNEIEHDVCLLLSEGFVEEAMREIVKWRTEAVGITPKTASLVLAGLAAGKLLADKPLVAFGRPKPTLTLVVN